LLKEKCKESKKDREKKNVENIEKQGI